MLTRARAKAAASVAPWAELLPEVVQRIARLLEDEDRAAMLRSCATWCAAIQAVPALWPEVKLFGQSADCSVWEWEGSIASDGLRQAQLEASAANKKLLQRAAELDPLCWGVRIIGCYDQPTLAHALLAVLPTTVRQLRLEVQCSEPMALLLQRFSRLESLSIGGWQGNGAELQWGSRAAAASIPKLTSLRLDFRRDPEWDGVDFNNAAITPVSPALPPALSAATLLTSLELLAEWSTETGQLCSALTALEDLRLTVYQCKPEHAEAALAALAKLPTACPRTLGLTLVAGWSGGNVDPLHDLQAEDWDHWVYLSNMAQLAGRLTALTLAGAISLPPDWRQLHELRSLRTINQAWVARRIEFDDGHVWGGFSWGSGSLSALTALTSLELSEGAVLPDPADLATAPSLAKVWAPAAELGAYDSWRQRLQQLLPDIDVPDLER